MGRTHRAVVGTASELDTVFEDDKAPNAWSDRGVAHGRPLAVK